MTDAPRDPVARMEETLTRERWKTLEPLIDEAVELAPEQRQAFLDVACGGDAHLRAELMLLLADYDREDTLLDRPAAERFASVFDGWLAPLPAVLGDRYRLERELGRGGMAIVYLAQDIRHERKVAVKVLHPELAAALGAERFLAEIRTTAQLQHPHILPMHDSGDAGGLLFYVMPYVEGESLRQRLQRENQLPVDEAVRIACEVAGALDSAHRHGVIHRDIKPENILLHGGSALVADFGIALAASEAAGPRLTGPGLILGTPQYMSPEQATGERAIDARTDIYSLGTVLYEMLAGEPPFTGVSATAIQAKRSTTPATPLHILRVAIPAAVEAAVARALAREPADRFRSAGEFATALQGELEPSKAGEALRRRPARGRRATLAVLALAAIVLGIGAVGLVARSVRTARARDRVAIAYGRNSIAVLPLANLGNDSANVFFAEGMTDALSSALGRVPGVRVVSGRSSAFLSSGNGMEPQVIGRNLRVAMILQGSVQRASRHLRVVIDLVSSADGGTLWTNQYTRELRDAVDVFAVEDAIVRDIIGQLRITLTGQQASASTRRPTENLSAYDHYLQGKYFQDKGGPENLRRALGYFQQAIGTDSNLAPAHSGTADVYIAFGIGNAGDYRPDEYFPKARAAVRRALAIDSSSAEAHTAEGRIKLLYDFDWAGAERDIGRALELDPRYIMARTYHMVLLEFTGRFDSAVAEARTALDDNPQSMLVNIEAARALIFARRYDQAIVRLERTLERDSTHFRAHLLLGQALQQTGRLDSAVAEMQRAVRLNPSSSRTHAFLAHAYAVAGRTDDAWRELGVMQERVRNGYVPAFDFAVAYVGLRRMDAAFVWLEKAFDEHSIRPYLMDPTFDPIRSDPRYQQLLRRMNHPLANAARAHNRFQ